MMHSPAPLHLLPRKLGALIALPFVAFFSIGALMCFPALVSAFFSHELPLIEGIGALVLLVIAAAATVGCLRALSFEGPALVLDENGVCDRRKKGLTIASHQMRSIRIGGSETDQLVIRLRDTAAARPLRSAVKRLFEGGDIVIGLAAIKYEMKILKQTIAGYMSSAAAATPPACVGQTNM